ncbi:MAG: hypothetical protein K8I02_05335, partial [Candidatus Methylomirabilis sp.]|nr:hypothetical protein [Deltaproteobacteria bacterium]
EVLAEGTLTPPPPGCAAAEPAQVPAGAYFTGKVEQDGSGLVRVYFDGNQVLSTTVPASESAGGFAGVYYEGAAGAFDDFTLQGPEISADPHVSVSVDASQPGETAPEGFFGAMLVWLALTNGMDAYFGDWDELRDNLAALETVFPLISEMGVKSLRFPGGLVSNEYDWKLHIGDFYGDKNDPRHPNGLSLDEFMQMAENLGAKPVFTVNASDPGWGWGPIVGAQEAADLVEYLTIPYDGSNPDPDGLSPTDPDNIDWAKRRADDGRIEPYKILGFEIGNELRGPPYLLQTPPATAYANRLVGFASAMKAVNPNIKIGAVGADVPGRADYAPWYETVYNAISTSNCDLRPLDGIPAPCADFWIKHILGPGLNVTTPGSQGFGYDGQGAVVERGFEVPVAGSYKIALSAHTSGITGPYPLLQMQVDGGAAVDHVFDIRNNGVETHPAWTAMHLYRSPAFTLSAGTHTIRFTRQNNGIGATNRRLLLYPTVHLERATDPASFTRIDLKDTEVLSRLLQSTATSNARFVLDPSPTPGGTLYGLPLWITELYFAYEQYDPPVSGQEALQYAAPMDPTVDDLREALAEANLYADFWNQGVQQVSSLLLFDEERGAGLVEGVALDIRHGDQTLLDRYGTPNPPRLRPRGMMLAEMTRHWKGRKLPTSTAGPTYDVLGNTLDGFSIGS